MTKCEVCGINEALFVDEEDEIKLCSPCADKKLHEDYFADHFKDIDEEEND